MPQSYLDSGFDEFFETQLTPETGEITGIDQDALFSSISADKISDGIISSSSGRNSYDLIKGTFTVNDGTVDRVELGVRKDGEIGLIIRDQNGSVLVDIGGTKNLIQSATGKMQLDLTEEQARWYDETKLRILLGKALRRL